MSSEQQSPTEEKVDDEVKLSSTITTVFPISKDNSEQNGKPYTNSIIKSQDISEEPANPTPEIAVTSYGKKVTYRPLPNLPGVYHVESRNDMEDDGLKVKTQKSQTLANAKVETLPNAFSKDKEKDNMKKLKDFNIPGQKTLLNVLLEDDFYMHNFNGYIREYYSHVLRSYCLMNMQGRYRGLQPNATCLTMIDISKLSSKEAMQEKQQREYALGREAMINKLRAVALDELHFGYLKDLANNQPLILPISIMYEILMETTPVVKNIWSFYRSRLGKNHDCSRQAGQHYVRLVKRQEMYQHLGFGDSIVNEV